VRERERERESERERERERERREEQAPDSCASCLCTLKPGRLLTWSITLDTAPIRCFSKDSRGGENLEQCQRVSGMFAQGMQDEDRSISRVGQNHIYTVYIRYFLAGKPPDAQFWPTLRNSNHSLETGALQVVRSIF